MLPSIGTYKVQHSPATKGPRSNYGNMLSLRSAAVYIRICHANAAWQKNPTAKASVRTQGMARP